MTNLKMHFLNKKLVSDILLITPITRKGNDANFQYMEVCYLPVEILFLL